MSTFSALPLEIHDMIAKKCQNNDIINLSCTSNEVKELYFRVLFRHVDLRLDRYGVIVWPGAECNQIIEESKWQDQFFKALLTHPEYAQHVRSLRALLHVPSYCDRNKTRISNKEMWRAMQLITHVQSVDMGSRNAKAYRTAVPTKQFPKDLFRSATSVTLVGHMPYDLAKSILNAVNPATLKYLCLDMVHEWDCSFPHIHMPGDEDEEGRIIAYGATLGLLTTLTGCCTALQTLILRRVGQTNIDSAFHVESEDLSHIEWASFIRSVQGTVERFTFELAGETQREQLPARLPAIDPGPFRIADERFRRLILPTIIAGNWPCLTIMELKGVRSTDGQVGTAALITQLTALLGGNTEIVVEEKPRYVLDENYPQEFPAFTFSSDDSENW